uniref:ZP domain-containing protein n=1 Tax=Poecilia latipinna TaxID=48699 RepID=A0A3B3VDX7_9TELE
MEFEYSPWACRGSLQVPWLLLQCKNRTVLSKFSLGVSVCMHGCLSCLFLSGTMSVSRCQLFEAGFHSSALHLRDSSCNGTLQDGRLVFHFDNDNHLCGTALRVNNGTHFMYENTIQGNVDPHGGLINRERNLHLDFCCVYPLVMIPFSLFFYFYILISYSLSITESSKQISIAYTNGNIELEVDEMFYMEVRTEGVDQRQFATVLDSCWATPVNQANYPVRWDLITSLCPNPEDGTVEVIQNGVSTVSRFSFRMFTFTNHTEIYLHCNVHLCLLRNNNCTAVSFIHCYLGHHARFRRDASYHDSAALSIGPLVLGAQPNTGKLCHSVDLDLFSSLSKGGNFVFLNLILTERFTVQRLPPPWVWFLSTVPLSHVFLLILRPDLHSFVYFYFSSIPMCFEFFSK